MQISSFLLLCLIVLLCTDAKAMKEMPDEQLAGITGQALIQMAKTPGTGNSPDINFYRAGLDAVVELNMNIEKLQLGCGGINGPGCDIDIDNLSLSGNAWGEGRPESAAILTRPFFEFAVRNDGSKTLREVVGIRLSAEQATGLLTMGTENLATPNGINALSGYMEIAATNGVAQTLTGNDHRFGSNQSCSPFGCGPAPSDYDPANRPNPSDETVTGKADVSVALCTTGCGIRQFMSDPSRSTGVLLPGLEVPFNIDAFTLKGTRMTSAQVYASAPVPDINLHHEDADGDGYSDGALFVQLDQTVCSSFFICMDEVDNLHLRGTVTNLDLNIDFQQDLGYIHKIPVNNPFSLSMQSNDIQWPGAVEVAQQGWWMSFQDPVDLGELNPLNKVDIRSVYPQIAALISEYMWENPIDVTTGDAWDALTSGHMYKDVGAVDLAGASVDIKLQDLQLSTQDFQANCWGSARFC